ncbi:unnamed protein product [Parnassius apollo]|uniref:(apollo) hypothetical protein n=1 Tax=Parnassius apollo TaxID=110799 RepID=A0A8S3Y1R0_PARAO|nr:unnamed protein product [Parnassius apollo]
MYCILACLFLFSGSAIGLIIRDVPCNLENITAVRDLNLTRMIGEWHQLKRIQNSDENGACSTLTIDISHVNNSTPEITIMHREIYNKTAYYRNGTIIFNNSTAGVFAMQFSNVKMDTVIVATDYSKYALFYSCMDTSANKSAVWAWVYSRSTSLQQVETDTGFQAAVNGNSDLKNASWISIDNSLEACDISAGVTFRLSPILALLAALIVCKDFVVSK